MDNEEASWAVLENRRVYVDEVVFFRLLQDIGQQMSNKEKDRLSRTNQGQQGKERFTLRG
jgi:hypothetical protein